MVGESDTKLDGLLECRLSKSKFFDFALQLVDFLLRLDPKEP